METVSVIIPTHKRSSLLREAAASVIYQTQPPSEILVVDDACDSLTKTTVDEISKIAPCPVRYIINPAGGVCRSRNLGAEVSWGAFLAFLDDDDLWRPEFLAEMLRLVKKPAVSLAIGGIVRHLDDGTSTARAQSVNLNTQNVLHGNGSMTGSNFLIDRLAFSDVGGFDPEVAVFNDWDLFVRLIDAGVSYAVCQKSLVDWRAHPGSRIASPSLRRAVGIEHFIRKYRRRMSRELHRDLQTTALGIRLAHSTGPFSRLKVSLELAVAHGPIRAISRLARRVQY